MEEHENQEQEAQEQEAQEEWDDEEEYIEDAGSKTVLIWIGGGLFALVVIIALLFFGGEDHNVSPAPPLPSATLPQNNLAGPEMEKLHAQIEELHALTKDIAGRMEGLEKRQKDTLAALGRITNKVNDMARRPKASGKISHARPAPKAAAPKLSAKEAPKKASSKRRYYIVKEGETLYRIGLKSGVTPENIRKFNKLPNNNIKLGQKLYLEP